MQSYATWNMPRKGAEARPLRAVPAALRRWNYLAGVPCLVLFRPSAKVFRPRRDGRYTPFMCRLVALSAMGRDSKRPAVLTRREVRLTGPSGRRPRMWSGAVVRSGRKRGLAPRPDPEAPAGEAVRRTRAVEADRRAGDPERRRLPSPPPPSRTRCGGGAHERGRRERGRPWRPPARRRCGFSAFQEQPSRDR